MKPEVKSTPLSKTDSATVKKANALVGDVFKTLPNSKVKSGEITREDIDKAQQLAERIEEMRIRKKTKNPSKLHWQCRRAFGRLKAARAAIDYPHERQVAAAEDE